jgi:hypothetical protein
VLAASFFDDEQPVIARAIADAAATRRNEFLRIHFSISSQYRVEQRGPSNLSESLPPAVR